MATNPEAIRRLLVAICALLWSAMIVHGAGHGAGESGAPLSAIEWLDRQSPMAATEPPVTRIPPDTAIAIKPFDQSAHSTIGLVPGAVTGLPETLWMGSDGAQLARELAAFNTAFLPAIQDQLYALLLSAALPAAHHGAAFDLARIDTLIDLGALDPALALAEAMGPTRSVALFARYFDLSLIAGAEEMACRQLVAAAHLSPSRAADVFCIARTGAWRDAVLVFQAAVALGQIDNTTADALARFLDPDLFEQDPPLPTPVAPDALLFTLYDALGQRLATRPLPRVFANADLRERTGWKTRLEAAEQLALSGALAQNKLLGLMSMRRPAASGGIWDRVAAFQALDRALEAGDVAALASALPKAWQAAKSRRMETLLAGLFAERLLALDLDADTAQHAFEIVLLSPHYERAAQRFPDAAARAPLLAGIAAGVIPPALPPPGNDPLAKALADGFTQAVPPDTAIIAQARNGALGAAILSTLRALDAGARGDMAQLPSALAGLRALGLEDTARRAALQIVLLERSA